MDDTTPHPPGTEPLTDTDPGNMGPFRLVRRLGSGGMGVVYAGVDREHRPAAVKTVHRSLAEDPDFRDRFAREVELVRRVRTPFAPAHLSSDTSAAVPWLATEYVPGATLHAAVREHGPLPEPMVRALGAAVAEALRDVHGLGIVHRDLKPANIVLSPEGPRVLDFGIARALDATALTRTGTAVGTPGWIAPELQHGEEPGPAADVFAWGALTVFAATGRNPFGSGEPEVMLHRTAHAEPDLSGLPSELVPLVRAALDKDPARRPAPGDLAAGALSAATPEEAAERLPEFLAQVWRVPDSTVTDTSAWSTAPRHRPRSERRNRLLVWAAAAAAVLLVAGGGWFLGTQNTGGEGDGAEQGAAAGGDADGGDAEASEDLTDDSEGGPDLLADTTGGEPYTALGVLPSGHDTLAVHGTKEPLEPDPSGLYPLQDADLVVAITMNGLEREGEDLRMTGTAQYGPDEGDYTLHGRELEILLPNEDSPMVDDYWAEGSRVEFPAVEDQPLVTVAADDPVQDFEVTFEGVPDRGVLSYGLPAGTIGEAYPESPMQQAHPICYDTAEPDWSDVPPPMQVPWYDCAVEGFEPPGGGEVPGGEVPDGS